MKRITEYTNIETIAETDVIPIVDVSDTEQASTGSTRKGTIATIADYIKDRAETLTNKILTTARLNTPKINEDVAVTATATELNTLDGITASTTELNTLDGITASTTELNLLDNQTVLRKQAVMSHSGSNQITAGQTKYFASGYMGVSAYTPSWVFPCAGTIKNLYVYSDGSPGTGQTYTCTLMRNNVAQSVTCTIVEGSNQSSDTTHSFLVYAGERVSLRVVASASAVTTAINYGFEFDPS